MAIQLHSSLQNHYIWKEIVGYANTNLVDNGFDNYEIFIRPAQKMSNVLGNLHEKYCTATFDEKGRYLELVFSPDVTTNTFNFYDLEPKEFAEIIIMDTLCQFIEDEELPSPEQQRKQFKIIDGGKLGE